MIYHFSLQAVGLVVGAVLLAAHLFAAFQSGSVRIWLKKFPRSRVAGTVLLALAAVWSLILVKTMDLGEFAPMRLMLVAGVAVGAVLTWQYVDEFLAVRALGMLALLAADPLLEAAFLQPEKSRLILVVLAYVWAILGLFWVSLPWLLRDQIAWLTGNAGRFHAAVWGGAAAGGVILACAAFLWA